MSKREKEHYKVLSDKDRKRFDTEKKLVKKKPKKREAKEEEKRIPNDSTIRNGQRDIGQSLLEGVNSKNFTIDSSNSALSSGLNYQNVAEAYINEAGVFTTAASTSTGRLRSLEQDNDENNSTVQNIHMHKNDDSPEKFKHYVEMGLMTNQNIDSYNLNSVNQKDNEGY